MCKEDSYASREAARKAIHKSIHQDKSPSELPHNAKKLVKALRALSASNDKQTHHFDFADLKFTHRSCTEVWGRADGEHGMYSHCIKLVSQAGYPPKWGLFLILIDMAGFYESHERGYFNSLQELADALATQVCKTLNTRH